MSPLGIRVRKQEILVSADGSWTRRELPDLSTSGMSSTSKARLEMRENRVLLESRVARAFVSTDDPEGPWWCLHDGSRTVLLA